MKDFRKSLEDNYLTFITVAAGAVALVALLIWAITIIIKKVNK